LVVPSEYLILLLLLLLLLLLIIIIIIINRSNIVLNDKREKTCLLIERAIRDYSNFNTNETENLNKYKDLEIEFIRMWKIRTKIVPIMFGRLGTIKKGIYQNARVN
jgi:hypothetical protein